MQASQLQKRSSSQLISGWIFVCPGTTCHSIGQRQRLLRKEGLAVDIKEGAGSGQTVNLVNAREADIALADYMLMANGISKGMQIKGVYGLLQRTRGP